MNHSETFAAVAGALSKAQGAFPMIPRDRSVKVNMKAKANGEPGGSYTFSYAPLETILEKTRPGLSANGLCLVQAVMLEDLPDGKQVEVLRTTLIHETGEWFSNDVPMFAGTGDNKAQAYNSGTTYARRSGVTLLLCVAADEDDDGNGGDQTGRRPDYDRQETSTRYQGSFPKQGGGKTTPPRREPEAPARRADPEQAEGVQPPALDTATGEIGSPYGADLTPGQRSLIDGRAMALDFGAADLIRLFGVIDSSNVSAALAELKRQVNAKDAA